MYFKKVALGLTVCWSIPIPINVHGFARLSKRIFVIVSRREGSELEQDRFLSEESVRT